MRIVDWASVETYPASDRNKAPILEVLQRVLPSRGTVLEVASGTGQHVIHFAEALPGLRWQPTEPDAVLRASILERIEASGLTNVAPPVPLDVRRRPWPVESPDAILCINMIHIAPWDAALALLAEAGALLRGDGLLFLYGPYRRGGQHTAQSNAEFDAGLRRRNPAWGVRDLDEVARQAGESGLVLREIVAMPANNLSVVFGSAA
jgi:SAM-dependent methyltransferase